MRYSLACRAIYAAIMEDKISFTLITRLQMNCFFVFFVGVKIMLTPIYHLLFLFVIINLTGEQK